MHSRITSSLTPAPTVGPRSRPAYLFQLLNTGPESLPANLDEDLAGFTYINGDLFAVTLPIPSCDEATRDALLAACKFDWSAISPAIFGSMFQNVMTPAERRHLGAHYTTEENILKILDPDFTWEPEETRAAGDEAARYLTEYPITDWEIEGAFGLFVQFVHDWATGEYSNSTPSNGPASAFTPSSDHDLDVLDLVVDEGPTFE